MSATYPTKLRLAFRSGDHCGRPDCDKPLVVDNEAGDDQTVVGVAAHIAGEKPEAARYVASMTELERDHYNNLIYLCGRCHTIVDDREDDYPIVRLLKIKAEHEAKVRDAINAAFADVGFPELAQAAAWITQTPPGTATQDLSVLSPDEKIKKNSLTASSRGIIAMGLSVVREVRAFVEGEAQLDPEFPNRLKAGFLTEYYRLQHAGHRGDELFDLMCQFAQRGMKEQAKRSAGLAVLIYLFECCEVFEK